MKYPTNLKNQFVQSSTQIFSPEFGPTDGWRRYSSGIYYDGLLRITFSSIYHGSYSNNSWNSLQHVFERAGGVDESRGPRIPTWKHVNAAKDMLFGLESVQPPLSSDTSSSFAHRSSSTVEQWRTSQPVKFDRYCGNDSITQDLSEACGQSRGFPPIALLSRLLAVNDCGSYFTEQIARNELDSFAIIGL